MSRSFCIVFALIGALVATPAATIADAPPPFAERGQEIMTLIRRDFSIRDGKLYAGKAIGDYFSNDGQKTTVTRLSPDFAWGSGVQLTALTAAAHIDRDTYLPLVRKYIDGLDAYWIVAPTPAGKRIGGYDVLPHAESADRYYDDNAWLALGLLEAYDLNRDPKDLDRAKATVAFVLSGEDQKLGGGLYWREQKLESKNTCANAPGILAVLRLYQVTHEPSLLGTAKRLYNWTRRTLQGQDGTYYDNISISTRPGKGQIAKFALTYNSALMIRDECVFYDLTHDQGHLTEAERIADSGIKRWVDRSNGSMHDSGRFAHLFAESLLELSDRDHNPRWANTDHAALDFLWEHNRESSGFYPDRWDTADPRDKTAELIAQASAARAYFRAAWK